jgi:hypothetical protein
LLVSDDTATIMMDEERMHERKRRKEERKGWRKMCYGVKEGELYNHD